MNREAAVLGTPTYSLFKGKLAAVDRYLMEKGRMKHIDSVKGIASMPICKKTSHDMMMHPADIIKEVVDLMVNI